MNMIALCAGLAIQGICAPLPSMHREVIGAGGWIVVQDELHDSDWWSNMSFSTGSEHLVVAVAGRNEVVVSVALLTRSQLLNDRIDEELGRVCLGADGGDIRSCRTKSGISFRTARCRADAVLVRADNASIESLRRECAALPLMPK